MRIVCFLVNRANYGRLYPVLNKIRDSINHQLFLVATGTMVEEEYGYPVMEVESDGFTVHHYEKIEVGMRTHKSMALTTSNALQMAVRVLSQDQPDLVLIIGDRYETLGIATASAFLNIPIAHFQGGELSGSIDDKIRHSITKLSDYHFVANDRARKIVMQLGEPPERVFNVGCTSSDYLVSLNDSTASFRCNHILTKYNLMPNIPFVLISYHPNTTNLDNESFRVNTILSVVKALDIQALWISPNSDAGSMIIEQTLDEHPSDLITKIVNISPLDYAAVMKRSILCIGNSSSFVRDSGFLGTPVVLLGNRQKDREISPNVLPLVDFNENSLLDAANQQIKALLSFKQFIW